MQKRQVKRIVAEIKKKTAMKAYKLSIEKDSKPDIFDSKFGGVPYWDMGKEYPLDSKGKKMMLLAQINFTKAGLEDERLPKQGILQFFIASEDDVYGMDWDQADSQKDFRVIYHETIDESITKEQVLQLDIPISTSEEDSDYLYDECNIQGHWILGYPFFTQYDPREGREDSYYNTLLFQMDSEMIDHEDYVLWGDCGVANFFINDEALGKLDFSKILYNWDCF